MYNRMWYNHLIGSYHLLIATEVAKDLEAWHDFWVPPEGMIWPPFEGPGSPIKPFIIMDNGLIEAGAACDPHTLKEAAHAVNASCIVLPDVLGDYGKTLKAVKSSFIELEQLGFPLLGVVQGHSLEQVHTLAEFYTHIGVEFLSVPRVMVDIFGSRQDLVRRLSQYGLPIHLLGFSDNLEDDIATAHLPGVMGIDSAVPLWYPGILPPSPPRDADFGKRPKDFWDWDPMKPNYHNVVRVREWLQNGVQSVHTQEGQQEPEGTQTPPSA
jgi:hypothetical protein